MAAAKQPPEQKQPIADRLHAAGITKVAIIDDAYDTPTVNSFYSGELDDFWSAIERNSEMLDELRDLKPDIQDVDDIDDEVIIALWQNRGELKKLSEPCKNQLFVNKIEMRDDVDTISKHLQDLGLDPDNFDSENLPDSSVRLVFIDYVFDPTATGDKRGEIAKGKARKIYDSVENDAEKPFIILMSNQPDVEAQKEIFRKDSKLIGGLFGFMSKDDLKNQEKLYLALETWSIDIPQRHNIQRFVEALAGSVKEASDKFIDKVKELSFEDYANIQWLSLQPDGQPLGDYMLRLYKSYLAYLVHDNPKVLAEQKKLDKLSFDKFYPSQNKPSPQLAEIYRHALTEPGVGEIEVHPRSDPFSKEPLLQLGDIFIRDKSHEVLMVINPACDLMFAPETSRGFPQEMSILLLPGVFQALDENIRPNIACTELFNHDGKAFRIAWGKKQVISKKYKEVWDWLSIEKYSRISRLRLPYALEVQQAFAANLTRIGMPVKPPFYRNADVEVYCEDENGMCLLLEGPVKSGASIVNCKIGGEDKYEDLFSLTIDCRYKLSAALDKAIEQLEKQRESIASSDDPKSGKAKAENEKAEKIKKGKSQGIDGKIKKIELLKNPDSVLLQMHLTHHNLPTNPGGHSEVDTKLLWVYRDGNFQEKYPANPPIAINIKCTANPSNLDTPNVDISDKQEADTSSGHHGMVQGSVKKVDKFRRHIEMNISRVRGWFQNLVC
jgi:hypothetical protein